MDSRARCTGTFRTEALGPIVMTKNEGQEAYRRMTKRAKLMTLVAMVGVPLGGCEQRPPDVKLNSAPKSTYQLDVAFSNIPQAVQDVEIETYYRVESGCVKAQQISGAFITPQHWMTLSVTKIDENRYQAVFHRDALRDEDYYGLGVCRWHLQNVSLRFSSQSTKFITGLSHRRDETENGSAETKYFLHRDFFEKPEIMDLVFGENEDHFRLKMKEKFSVTLTSKKLPR
jgi:hypothetical protein